MCQVVLIRPGSTDFDEQNRIQGRLDLPLNDQGETALSETLRSLEAVKLSMILADPGEPARSTAIEIGERLDLPVKFKEELRNLDQGLWQGLKLEEVRRKYPKLIRQWQESPEAVCPPQGEAVGDALERVRKVLKKPLNKKNGRIGIVAAEPLASLIASIVCKTELTFRGPICSGSGEAVQFLVPVPPKAGTAANCSSSAVPAVDAALASVNGHGHSIHDESPHNGIAEVNGATSDGPKDAR